MIKSKHFLKTRITDIGHPQNVFFLSLKCTAEPNEILWLGFKMVHISAYENFISQAIVIVGVI